MVTKCNGEKDATIKHSKQQGHASESFYGPAQRTVMELARARGYMDLPSLADTEGPRGTCKD